MSAKTTPTGIYNQRLLMVRDGILYAAGLAAVAAAQGKAVQAARMIGAVDATLEAIGHSMPPQMSAMYERTIKAARACVDEATYIDAWKEGRATPLERFVADTLEQAPEGG